MDECHHAKENHPYRLFVSEFYDNEIVQNKMYRNIKDIQIIGLTASPIIEVNVKKIMQQEHINYDEIEIKLLEQCLNLKAKYVYNKQQNISKEQSKIILLF